MKLLKLRVRSFRNITDTTLDIGASKFVVLRGQNRQGKTSIGEALSLALTPTTTGLSAKGDGYVRKIKRGETKATLEAELQTASKVIKRTVTLNVNSTGRTQASEDVNDPEWHSAKFEKLLTDKKTAFDIALNTRAFQSMIYSGDEKAQKNLLAQLVLPAHYDFPKETIADVESVFGRGTIMFDGEPFAVIELAYKKLFTERQDVNRKVKEFSIPDALPRPQGVNSESLKTQLEVLREDRKKQSAERDAASKKSNEETLKAERNKAKVETLEAVLKASKETLRTIQENILPNSAAVQEIANREPERVRLLAEQQRIEHEQSAAKKEADRLNKISLIGEASCPTCDQEIDQDKLVALMQSVIADQTRLAEEIEVIGGKRDALGREEDIEDASDKLEKHRKALAEKDEATVKVETDTRTLKEAKAESGKVGGGLFDPTSIDTAISKTDKDIEAILQQIQPVIAAEEREKDIATKKDQLARLEAKAAKLDRLTKYFDKDGVKAKLIAEYIGGFEQKVNEVLLAWDYSCSLSIEPFKFDVTNYRKDVCSLIDLSGAEELMFYAAFQCAVSRTAGIGFVVIDRVDTLLPDLRPALFKHLHAMISDGTLDQVILLIADTSEQVPKIPDSRFFVVEEGNVRRLG